MPIKSSRAKRKQYKRIQRKTGAKSQSKQIVRLAKQVNKLTEISYEKFMMRWSRKQSNVEGVPLAFGPSLPFATVIPVPVSCATELYDLSYSNSWCSNENVASPPIDPTNDYQYSKTNVFGRSQNAWQTSQVHHMGGTLRWRLVSGTYNEPREYLIALVSLRNADQITTTRLLKKKWTKPTAAGAAPELPTQGSEGSLTALVAGTDYTFEDSDGNGTDTGFMLNPKIYNIHYARRVTLGSRNIADQTTSAVNTTSNSGNTNLIAVGNIRIPRAGKLVSTARRNSNSNFQINSGQDLPYSLEPNHKTKYLIVLGTVRSTAANTPASLSISCLETYQASGGPAS